MVWTGNVTRQPMMRGVEYRSAPGGYPNADRIMEHALLLPCNHHMTADDVDFVCRGAGLRDVRGLTAQPSVGTKSSEAEFMQNRSPVGRGPSGKTCPRWARQVAHSTSTRLIPWLRSSIRVTLAGSSAAQNDGQPEPESYFVSEENSGSRQTTQR